jgi:hypothetical protein
LVLEKADHPVIIRREKIYPLFWYKPAWADRGFTLGCLALRVREAESLTNMMNYARDRRGPKNMVAAGGRKSASRYLSLSTMPFNGPAHALRARQ